MINNLPTLYKTDSKNKTREWKVFVENGNTIVVIHGLMSGAKQIKKTVIASGKNIGKANETSIEEQAYAEALSKWNKQKDKGYGETAQRIFLPMLAHQYKDHKHKIKFPCFVQPKFDGVRCTIRKTEDGIKSFSRLGKEWKTTKHIKDCLEDFFDWYPTVILDGELYSHELTFQEIISAVKREEYNELTEKVKFYCYDCYDPEAINLTFEDRLGIIYGGLHTINQVDHIVLVETNNAQGEKDIVEYHNMYVENGYEGVMLRNVDGLYKFNGRSYDLQKVKQFMDEEFKITGIKLDKNNECVFTCATGMGSEFDVKPKGSHEERFVYYNKENIGKMLTVRFFDWTTSLPKSPRFPIGIGIRNYE